MLCFFPNSSSGLGQICISDLFLAAEITWCDLDVDIDVGVSQNRMLCCAFSWFLLWWNGIKMNQGYRIASRLVYHFVRCHCISTMNQNLNYQHIHSQIKQKYLHIAHRYHIINLPDPQPMQDIQHESLESHIFDTYYQFCQFEVFVCRVSSLYTKYLHHHWIIHQCQAHGRGSERHAL